ncbi:type II toxin-antitoxin system death-on-curing family toxin [Desulfobacula sp.]|uniref:type II toxin-antitoxin system death-on-curing family toxin n=1 Tax=Desulfobacula sp. TaxID=2593537 RepID=UPI00260AC553|nr:type II toxin-antitoxin system death-on-curing family toxin [Desulfobacula sp.]
MTYNWIELDTVLAVHDIQIAEHGGAPGIRDIGLIESALTIPRNLLSYGTPGVVELAAAYGFALTKNHGFIDGNKRTAYVVTRLFLRLHGMDFNIEPIARVFAFEKLGKGDYSAEEFTQWLKSNSQKIEEFM